MKKALKIIGNGLLISIVDPFSISYLGISLFLLGYAAVETAYFRSCSISAALWLTIPTIVMMLCVLTLNIVTNYKLDKVQKQNIENKKQKEEEEMNACVYTTFGSFIMLIYLLVYLISASTALNKESVRYAIYRDGYYCDKTIEATVDSSFDDYVVLIDKDGNKATFSIRNGEPEFEKGETILLDLMKNTEDQEEPYIFYKAYQLIRKS